MKKITLLITLLFSLATTSFSQIWVNPLTTGRPISTFYLGDKLSTDWYFNFEIGQTTWYISEIGIGQNTDGSTGWNWDSAIWYEDGSGSNKHVRRNIGSFQFTKTDTWYIVGRAKAVSGDAYTYSDEGGWTNETTLTASTTTKSCPYFTVSKLNTPYSQTASAASSTSINLSWTMDAQSHNVMIVRYTKGITESVPTNGTAYSVGNTIGTGTVVYNNSGLSTTNTGLTSSSEYDFYFYSENNSYYSDEVKVTGSTQSTSTDYFRSKTTGNWTAAGTWESSNDNTNWITSTLAPTSSAVGVTVLAGHKINVDANTTVGTLTVSSTGILEVNAAKQLTVGTSFTNSGTVTLKSTVDGTATIKTPGSSNISGTFKVEQYLSSARNWYISSPVTGATASASYTYYKYHEKGDNTGYISPATAYWELVSTAAILTPMTGYIAQLASGTSTITFSGTALNTGTVGPVTLTRTTGKTKEGFNLVGNPFPAFLNIDNLASNGDLEPTYWYRSNNSVYVFDTYNIPSTLSTGNSGKTVSKYIPPMQAFWLRVKNGSTSASLSFSSANCAHQDNSNNVFRAPAAKTTAQQVLRLVVSKGTNSDEAIVYFNPNASNDFDDYDSHKMSNSDDANPQIFTTVGTETLAINGMNSISLDTEIPLGFTPGAAGSSFSIKASEFSNFDSGVKVILKDNQNITTPETDISDGTAYSFSSDAVATSSRFSIIFKSAGSVTGLIDNNDQKVTVYKDANNQVCIDLKASVNNPVTVSVYNSVGQKISTIQSVLQKIVVGHTLASGIYVVSVQGNGINLSRKISIN